MKQQVIISIGGELKTDFYINGIKQTPTDAFITIYDETGTVKQARTAAVITGQDISYLVPAAICSAIKYNWKAVWEFKISGSDIVKAELFDIIRYKFYSPVNNENLISRAPFLSEMNYQRMELASSGTLNTITCPNLTERDGYWQAGILKVLEGKALDDKRGVLSFAAGILTVDQNFHEIPDSTTRFQVIRSFEKEISEAVRIVQDDLKKRGVFINRILDPSEVSEHIINKALYIICFNFSTDPLDIWMEKAKAFNKEYYSLLSNLNFNYDQDDDGNIKNSDSNLVIAEMKGIR